MSSEMADVGLVNTDGANNRSAFVFRVEESSWDCAAEGIKLLQKVCNCIFASDHDVTSQKA
jgi:hypothetical protein